jgi:hypothetical protein
MFTNHLQTGYNPNKSLNASDLNVYTWMAFGLNPAFSGPGNICRTVAKVMIF